MSTLDAEADADSRVSQHPDDDGSVSRARITDVAGLEVRRLLPLRTHRTVGAWCFLDHYGPLSVDAKHGMKVPPHPHMGLQTVTWLMGGEVVHLDSLGSEQLIRPGELNLMTAGQGIAHAETSRPGSSDTLHGLQLWVALPDHARHGTAGFEHHGSLPEVGVGPFVATVILGGFSGVQSPATTFSDVVGVELRADRRGHADLELPAKHEYVATMAKGSGTFDGHALKPGLLLYLEPSEVVHRIDLAEESRLFLLGGVPLGEQILMWWNFVARTPAEMAQAVADWNDGQRRFGSVAKAADPPLLTPAFDVSKLKTPG